MPGRTAVALLCLVACSALPGDWIAPCAHAQSVADFYKGKQITIVIGTSPGGDYDLRGRMLARHMGKHIPGNPTIVPQNMPGGAGLQAVNWLANVAPRDGTALHMIIQSMPMNQLLGGPGVQYDAAALLWIGNTTNTPNTVATWHTTGVKTVEDAKRQEVVVGAAGTATPSAYYPVIMNAVLGTKFKVVTGYPGGNDVNMAMERGEVGGRGSNSWASWVSTRPQWLAEKKIHILVQIGLRKAPDLPDVPLLMDLATNEQDRAVLRFMSADTEYSRALAATPGVPPDRLETLRRAFDATLQDADFIAEAQKIKADISPSNGDEVQRVVAEFMNTPKQVVERTKSILGNLMKN